MRTPLLLLALAGLALAGAAPTAQAQGSQYHVVLSVLPPEEAFTPERPEIAIKGKVDLVGDFTMLLNMEGVPVSYEVTQAPAWLTVVVSPAQDVIHLSQTGLSLSGARTFTVTMVANGGMDAGAVDSVEITATVRPTSPSTPAKSVAQAVPVQFHVPQHEDECDEHASAAELLAAAKASQAEGDTAARDEDGTLAVQSGATTPVGTWYAIGAFGLVGAVAGLLVVRRLKR